jgi:hypothetical protein
MNAEKPAFGILKTNDWGDSMWYYVPCDCTDDNHAHTIDVEADEFGVNVNIYVTTTNKFWSASRWKYIWQLLTTGKIEFQSTIILQEQQAFNYAKALTSAVNSVKLFKSKRAIPTTEGT